MTVLYKCQINYCLNYTYKGAIKMTEQKNLYYSYERISTKEDRKKQTYNRQTKALNEYAKDKAIEYLISFKEDVSGKNFTDRKEWNKLEKIVRSGDTIVFKDISRFTREAENGYIKYMELLNKGINLVFIDNSTVSTEYIRQLLDVANKQNLVAKTSLESTIKLLIIVELDRVEQERKILIKRITDGIKASDKKSGRKQGSVLLLSDELRADIELYHKDRNIKQIDLMNKHNICRNTLKKYIAIISKEKE